MNVEEIIMYWKDASYRSSLSADQKERLPSVPVGDSFAELDDANLNRYVGASEVEPAWTPSDANDGNWCTVTWECMICPTHTTCLTC